MKLFSHRISRMLGKWISLLIVMGLMASSSVFAAEKDQEKDVYVGLDLNLMSLKAGGASLSTYNMRAKVGLDMFKEIVPVLSLESHFGFDLTEDSGTVNGFNANLHVNNYIGLYLKASHEIEDVVEFYGLLGFAAAQVQGDTFALDDDTGTGLSFGFGAGFDMPFDLIGTVEFMQLVNSDAFDILMFSFGVTKRM